MEREVKLFVKYYSIIIIIMAIIGTIIAYITTR